MSYMQRDRRLGFRVPLEIFLTQYVRDRPQRALSANLSDTGISLQTVKMPWVSDDTPDGTPVGLEFELPGTGEVIWARGEVCRSAAGDPMVHQTGVRFTAMPMLYARMLRDYCIESRRKHLGALLARIHNPALPQPV